MNQRWLHRWVFREDGLLQDSRLVAGECGWGSLMSKRNHGKKLVLKLTDLWLGFQVTLVQEPPENA